MWTFGKNFHLSIKMMARFTDIKTFLAFLLWIHLSLSKIKTLQQSIILLVYHQIMFANLFYLSLLYS